MFLTEEERRALIRVVENLFTNEEELYQVLSGAALHSRFLPETGFTDPHTATKQLVNILEHYGDVPEQPIYHALGALLHFFLERDLCPLLPGEARFFAWLIVCYSLVHDTNSITMLSARYRLSEIVITSRLEIGPYVVMGRYHTMMDRFVARKAFDGYLSSVYEIQELDALLNPLQVEQASSTSSDLPPVEE